MPRIQPIFPQPPYIVLDTETTGLDGQAEIVQLTLVAHDGLVLFDQLLKPLRGIPQAASAVHGITPEKVADCPAFSEVMAEVEQWFPLYGRRLVAYNAEFDSRILSQAYRHLGIHPPFLTWFCAMLAYADHVGEWNAAKGNNRWWKLEQACAREGIELTGAHNSLHDAQATLALIRKLTDGQP